MITGNKGEWSEIYALLKLLADKKLYTGDAQLNKVESLFYEIIRIIREEVDGRFEYSIAGDVVIVTGHDKELRIPISTFAQQAQDLLTHIRASTGTFSAPDTEAFMSSIHCKSLKAKSTSKTDIRIVIHDQRISQTAELGFSIKSQVGGDSTLLNAGKTTNFIYRIDGFKGTEQDIARINAIDTRHKIKDRIEAIMSLGGQLCFVQPAQAIFGNNLVLIDSSLPLILAELIKLFFTSTLSRISNLTDEIDAQNPLDYDKQFSHAYYEYKIKRFLTDVALGMMPSKVWAGQYDATGGYLIVKEDGDVLCYHIYNRNQFEDYLFHNTKLETASSTRHDFAKIYSQDGLLYFKLNLQIRFV